jgi:hypothetical protein
MRLAAAADSLATDTLFLPQFLTRIERRDLLIGPTLATEPAEDSKRPRRRMSRGSVTGTVRDAGGAAVPGVRVRWRGSIEVRADTGGRFTLEGLPVGTRQLDVIGIGLVPAGTVVDVSPDKTVAISILARRITALPAMSIRATSSAAERLAEIEDRRRLGLGHFMDSTQVARQDRIDIALEMMVGNRTCRVVVDGRITDTSQLKFYDTREIALIELERDIVPLQYQLPRKLCWVAFIWTKNALR